MESTDDTTDAYPPTRSARRPPQPHLVVSHSAQAHSIWRARPLRGTSTIGRSPDCDLPLAEDRRASRRHALLDGRALTDTGSNNGVFVNGVQGDRFELQVGDVVRIGDSILVVAADAPRAHDDVPEVFGQSPAVNAVVAVIRDASKGTGTLLVEGPPGAGKEYVSKALAQLVGSSRASVAVNCASLSEQLADSALFGHKRGAFTGAERDFDGAFLRANGGVLFLDEVGELPGPVQAKLLRALDQGVITPVGGVERSVDVRVVAATNRSLDEEVAGRRFRADLLSRLRGFCVTLPGLEDRREDILPFLVEILDLNGKLPLSCELAERIARAHYPGNLRDLRHLADRIRAISDRGARELDLDDLHRIGVPDPSPRPVGRSYKDAAQFASAARQYPTITALADYFGCDRKTIKTWAANHGVALGS